MIQNLFFRSFSLSICLLVFGTSGCGPTEPKRNAVSGKVTYKEKPIADGSITFLSPEGGVVGGGAIKDGKYDIPAQGGLLAGTYKVSISQPDPKGKPPEAVAGEAPGMGAQVPEGREVRDLLPKKYNTETTLTAEIKSGDNTVSFDLK